MKTLYVIVAHDSQKFYDQILVEDDFMDAFDDFNEFINAIRTFHPDEDFSIDIENSYFSLNKNPFDIYVRIQKFVKNV